MPDLRGASLLVSVPREPYSRLRQLTGAWRVDQDLLCGWEGCHGGSLSTCSPGRLFLGSRFDRYLRRLRASDDDQRGLVILDKSAYETTLQQMSVAFRTLGTRWGVIRRLADTPLFVDSRASRVIQLADHVAYAVFRRYQAGDAQYFDLVASKFDEEDGVVHGLAHKEIGNPRCMCPACLSRRINESRRS